MIVGERRASERLSHGADKASVSMNTRLDGRLVSEVDGVSRLDAEPQEGADDDRRRLEPDGDGEADGHCREEETGDEHEKENEQDVRVKARRKRSVVHQRREQLVGRAAKGLALNHGAEMRAIMTATMMWKSDWMRPK